MWEKFKQIDANVLIAFSVFYVLATLYVMLRTTLEAQKEQFRRLGMFMELVDKTDGRVLPCFYPDDAELQPEDFKAMFLVAKSESSQLYMWAFRLFGTMCPN